jgi:6-pyruvoyl tetrahydropterin synthase
MIACAPLAARRPSVRSFPPATRSVLGLCEGGLFVRACGTGPGAGEEVIEDRVVLDDAGFVADFGELDPLKDYLDAELDHRDLNEVLPVQPSCENIARYLHGWCQDNLAHRSGLRAEDFPGQQAGHGDLLTGQSVRDNLSRVGGGPGGRPPTTPSSSKPCHGGNVTVCLLSLCTGGAESFGLDSGSDEPAAVAGLHPGQD